MVDLVGQLGGLTLADKKKRSNSKKSVFSRHYNSLDRHLMLWAENLASPDYGKYAREMMNKIRVAYETAMNGYIDIQEDDMEDEFAKDRRDGETHGQDRGIPGQDIDKEL